jgi:membrane protease YdiL (CAAX protease family)
MHWPEGSFRFGPTALLMIVPLLIVLNGAYEMTHGLGVAPSALSSPLIIITTLLFTAILEGGLALLLLACLRWVSRLSLRELGYRPPHARDVATAIVGSIVMALVGDGGESLIESFTGTKHSQLPVEMLKHLHDPGLLGAFAGFAVVLVPLMEETIFRVFVFNAFARYGGFWFGAIVSGVLFGIAHGDVYALFPLALGGIVLAYVYSRTRNAYASMITHGLFNAFSIAALVFAPQLTK